jgi:translocation and assembly module TamB
VTIDPANIRLPDQTPPEVVDIDVVKVGAPPDQYGEEEQKEGGYTLALDVDVDIPARFFVRGRGLEAEFQGDLTVNGTASNPDLRGTMSVVRGWFDFIDKRLNLERGNLRFTGEGMMPMLDVVAENRTGDVTARIHLAGPADDFNLRLTSNPPLPDNEIMSRLLFGRRAGDLNPVQAVQLANALGRLAGRGGGPGLVAEARRSLGLDQLNVSGGGQGPAPAVGVGKYVREDVYLEVQRDFSTGWEEVSVEVELTPRIGVTGSASQLEGSQVGLNYKINY